jgi:DNA-binding NarL/FixJ family response regulator
MCPLYVTSGRQSHRCRDIPAGMASDPPSPYRVLIVDDIPEVREALRWALENESDLVVVAEAATGVEALTCVTAFTPDVVILDIGLPALDGYAVTHTLKASARPPVVVVLTMHSDPLSRQRAREAGSDGFAEKGAGWSALIAEVRRVLRARGS